MAGVYHAGRKTIADTLEVFLSEIYVANRSSLRYAIRLYRESKLDFVDCVLAGYHHVENQTVCTFDKKLQRALSMDMLARDKE